MALAEREAAVVELAAVKVQMGKVSSSIGQSAIVAKAVERAELEAQEAEKIRDSP